MQELLRQHTDRLDQAVWLLIVPVAAAAFAYGITMRRRALRRFAVTGMTRFLAPQASRARQVIKAILLTMSLALLVIALVGPRWGVEVVPMQSRQLDLMICLDVSRSMLAEDAGMSRLDRAKDDIERLLGRLAGGNVGLVTFAGRAELACPLTDDVEYFRLILDDVGIHSAPVGGTDLAKAIETARNGFGPRMARERAIILMTDGEDHGTAALDQARNAEKDGVRVFCVGIGDDKRGGLVPVSEQGDDRYVMYEGRQVWSKLDPERLSAIARAGGGEYHVSGQVTDRERTLEWIYLRRLAPQVQTNEDNKMETRKVRFHWFVAAGLVLLVFESLVREARKTDPLPMASEQQLEVRA